MRVFLAVHLPKLSLEVFQPRWLPEPAHGSAVLERDRVVVTDSAARMAGVLLGMKRGGVMVQMVAFSNPQTQLTRYLDNMVLAGFEEIVDGARIWRDVPNRKWHANFKGRINSSREVVLVHRAA